ncbi:phage baseplate assembly protein V [Roseomonas sp. HJA6]|uniref:Phage baseplate assembly protein V n=1 Tax=Roseomonas alba TaxID=2846776 RepID=A0ABS7AID9_9PROT|nr:phage baseplate assembly protein V [Neoroseomonas alba]
MDHETAAALRGQAVRGVVTAIRDGGPAQTVDVETHEGVMRSGIEVLQQYGVTSRAPDGAIVVLLALGGDQGDQVALPVACPSGRMAGLAPGEVALHDDAGNRVHLKAGGVLEIRCATSLLAVVGGTEFEVTAGGVRIKGDVEVEGRIHATGDIVAGSISLQTHRHGGVDPGAALTDQPT